MCQKYKEYSSFILNKLFFTQNTFELYIQIYNYRATDYDILNVTPVFWQVATASIFSYSLTKLYKIYDEDRDSISIITLLNFVESNMNSLAIGALQKRLLVNAKI